MHYSRCLSVKALVFQGDLSLRVGTDKAGTVLSNRLCRGKKKVYAGNTCCDIHQGRIEVATPALTCSLWTTISLTIMMLMRFPTLGSLYTAATCNKSKTYRQKMQNSTKPIQSKEG